MNRAMGRQSVLLMLMSMGAACGGQEVGNGSADEPGSAVLGDRLAALDHDLTVGASGDGVRAVQDYLTAYGYLPNAGLQKRYAAWRPPVAQGPARAGDFDETTAEAVRVLQRNFGLPVTGVVDEGTRTALQAGRCGVPDNIVRLSSSDKFALQGSRWSNRSLTWKMLNTDTFDLTLVQARYAAAVAFITWQAQTELTFTEVTGSGSADIEIHFEAVDGPNKTLAFSHYPDDPNGEAGDITVDTSEKWSPGASSNSYDLQTVLLHEIGHSLGLDHSSAVGGPAMAPTINVNSGNRVLKIDDNVAISAIYDLWMQMPGLANDIGAGADGSVWKVGTVPFGGGFVISKWNGSGWTDSDGGGVRISVDSNGKPWTVTSAGLIFRHTTNSPTSGSWILLPGSATDIAIGAEGSVWKIGTQPFAGGFTIARWIDPIWYESDGAAVRIAVGSNGLPWIVQDNGNIFYRDSTSPLSGMWLTVPGAGKDIAVMNTPYAFKIGNVPFITSTDFRISALDLQGATSAGGGAPSKYEWIDLPGAARDVTVGLNGTPWVVNSAGGIFRPTK